ncbi:hypothetical protein ACHAWF_015168 [Thalassiosira exigua]
MSYCNFCEGGLSNIAVTLGGIWDGAGPKTDVEHWANHPDIVGSVSNDPRRVSHNIWQRLASKGECVQPPPEPSLFQGCNDHSDCDDGNACTLTYCNESNLCAISETLKHCCGNGVCEEGEGRPGQVCAADCGPYTIKASEPCVDCHTIDGFMIDVALGEEAQRRIFVSSLTLGYSSPATNAGASIDVYVTTKSSSDWDQIEFNDWVKIGQSNVERYNPKRGVQSVEFQLSHHISLDIGEVRGFYFAASENILVMGEGEHSITNEHGVKLRSSIAVSGLFGDGIKGFSLTCEVSYLLDDSVTASIMSPSKPDEPEMLADSFTGAEASPLTNRDVPWSQPISALPNQHSKDGGRGTTESSYDTPAVYAGSALLHSTLEVAESTSTQGSSEIAPDVPLFVAPPEADRHSPSGLDAKATGRPSTESLVGKVQDSTGFIGQGLCFTLHTSVTVTSLAMNAYFFL